MPRIAQVVIAIVGGLVECLVIFPANVAIAFPPQTTPVTDAQRIEDGIDRFYQRWQEFSVSTATSTRVAVAGEESKVARIAEEQFTRIGSRYLSHSWILDDPVNFTEAPIGRTETLRTTIDAGELGNLISFIRQDDIGNEVSLADERALGSLLKDCSGPWYGSLESSGTVAEFPFALNWLSEFFKARPIREGEVRRESVMIGSSKADVLVISRLVSPGRKGQLYFDAQNGAPIGLYIDVSTFDLPGQKYQTPAEVPAEMRSSFFGRHRINCWLEAIAGSFVRASKITESEALDGTVQTWNEQTELTQINFNPSRSTLEIPRIMGAGIQVKIQSSPQIQAEWRNGRVVKVFRGDVVEELAKVRMRPAMSVWLWIFVSCALVCGIAFAVWRWLLV